MLAGGLAVWGKGLPMSLDDALDFIDKLRYAESQEDITAELGRLADRFGFTSFCVAGIPDPGTRFDGYLMISGWTDDWRDRYLENDYFNHDPVVTKLRQTATPFLWSEAVTGLVLPPTGKRIMDEAASVGMADGFCVPIYAPHGFQAAVSFGAPAIDIDLSKKSALHLASIHAHNRAREVLGAIERVPDDVGLTPRELECLKWCAAGKTSWEISQILNISQHTADWYLASATKKLQAVNRVQAVAEGFRKGLLH